MATVIELQAQLEALRKVRAMGLLTVRLADGRSLTYKSDSEMAGAAADLERQILAASGVPIHTVLVSASKGLDTP